MIIKDRQFQGRGHKHLSIDDDDLQAGEDVLIENCTFKDANQDMIWICASYQDIGIVTIKDCLFDGWWIADRSHPDAVQTFQDKGIIKEVRIINCRTMNTDHQAFFIDAQKVCMEGNWCRQGDVVIDARVPTVIAHYNSFESGFRYKGTDLRLLSNVIKWCKIANIPDLCFGNYVHYNWGSAKLDSSINTRLTKTQYNETIKAGLPPAKDAGYILYQQPQPDFPLEPVEPEPEPPVPEPPAPGYVKIPKELAEDFYNALGQALVEGD